MACRPEKLYIPAAKKPFKTYSGVGEKPPDKCSEPAQGQIGGRERAQAADGGLEGATDTHTGLSTTIRSMEATRCRSAKSESRTVIRCP